MVDTPERRPEAPPPEGVVERPTEVPAEVERVPGVKRAPPQVTAQVTDDSGQQLIQSDATKTVTIQIPATQSQLADWVKGSPASALTWLAAFWIRMIKKALHFGWRIIKKGEV